MVGVLPEQRPQFGPKRSTRKTIHAVQKWLGSGLELLFPIQCVGCQAPGSIWCSNCAAALERFDEPFCTACGLALGGWSTCPACRRGKPVLAVRAYARYTGRLVQALLHLKYRPDRKLASVMADWLTGLYPHSEWQASLVVPVPLSRSRFQQRGFNQAELLAHELAERLELPMAASQLRRVRETRSQVGLDPSERSLNVKGAFAAERGVFAGEAVLLVDDLCTTGATLAACAQAVLADGGGPVWGLTVGRA